MKNLATRITDVYELVMSCWCEKTSICLPWKHKEQYGHGETKIFFISEENSGEDLPASRHEDSRPRKIMSKRKRLEEVMVMCYRPLSMPYKVGFWMN